MVLTSSFTPVGTVVTLTLPEGIPFTNFSKIGQTATNNAGAQTVTVTSSPSLAPAHGGANTLVGDEKLYALGMMILVGLFA
jgi:hypothetical protein